MAAFSRLNFRSCFAAALAAVIAVSAAGHARAQGTHLWTQSSFEDFEKGTPDGVSITSDGRLREGPALRELLTTPSTFVWSVAADKSGTAYLGTGSPATVLRVEKGAKPFTLFESQGFERAGGAAGPGRHAVCGHAAERQSLQTRSACDGEDRRRQGDGGV